MGMPGQVIRFILEDHKRTPLAGNGLFIGRQSTHLTPDAAIALLEEERVARRPGHDPVVDRSTMSGRGQNWIDDRSALRLFSDAEFVAMDVSDYEGAEIVHNLNGPLPDDLKDRFDFVYNGSCLDNIFDSATSMRSIAALARPGGRVIHLEHGTDCNGPYVKFVPTWFYDYCVLNEFTRVSVFTAYFNSWTGGWDLYEWDPVISMDPPAFDWSFRPLPYMHYFILVTAEKAAQTTCEKSPIQYQYRSSREREMYDKLALANRDAKRSRPFVWNSSAACRVLAYHPAAGAARRSRLLSRIRSAARHVIRGEAIPEAGPDTPATAPNITFCRSLAP